MFWIALATAVALLAAAARLAAWRWTAPPLPAAATAVPATTILLPVRDEERDVADCVATLLAQTAAPFVRVLDDGSRDHTAAIVRELARGEPRLALETVAELPPGWQGKTHALWCGLGAVETDWVVATDADTRHHPELLARAHAAAAAQRLDLVSIAGRQTTGSLGESLLAAPVFAWLDFLLGAWGPAARGEGPAVANGQFILFSRPALAAAGGLAAVRGAQLDDVALAELFRAAGFRTGFVRAPEALAVRMYRGFAATWRGWRRNLAALVARAPRAAAAAILVFAAPAVLLAVALARGAWASAALLWGAGAAASALARATSRHPAWHGLLFPADALAAAALFAAAIEARWRRRTQRWRGREVTT